MGIIKKLRLIIPIVIILCIVIAVVNHSTGYSAEETRGKLYSYMSDTKNRQNAYYNGVRLNNGSSANTCVYFVSEVLRKNGINVEKSVSNTSQLIGYLEKSGWEKNYDYKKLEPGDLCFTTDSQGNKDGVPTHTYIFMGWVKQNDYKNAYICDNQAKDYKNKIYHTRNIQNVGTANGQKKDAFAYFMEKN